MNNKEMKRGIHKARNSNQTDEEDMMDHYWGDWKNPVYRREMTFLDLEREHISWGLQPANPQNIKITVQRISSMIYVIEEELSDLRRTRYRGPKVAQLLQQRQMLLSQIPKI